MQTASETELTIATPLTATITTTIESLRSSQSSAITVSGSSQPPAISGSGQNLDPSNTSHKNLLVPILVGVLVGVFVLAAFIILMWLCIRRRRRERERHGARGMEGMADRQIVQQKSISPSSTEYMRVPPQREPFPSVEQPAVLTEDDRGVPGVAPTRVAPATRRRNSLSRDRVRTLYNHIRNPLPSHSHPRSEAPRREALRAEQKVTNATSMQARRGTGESYRKVSDRPMELLMTRSGQAPVPETGPRRPNPNRNHTFELR